MSRKGKRKARYIPKAEQAKKDPNLIIKSLEEFDYQQLDNLSKLIPAYKEAKIQKSLYSGDEEDIVKASMYLQEQASKAKQPDGKSFMFLPDDYGYTGKGYKDTLKGVSFDVLQRMGDIFIVRSIVNTRVEQIQNFLNFETDEQKEGFTIRKKKSLYEKERKPLTARERLSAEKIVTFLEDGGFNDKWSSHDSFQDFIRKIVRDSLVLDQLAFETVRNRKSELVKYKAIDASLIRLLDSVDPRYSDQFLKMEKNGHLPRFCMAWNSQILKHPTTGQPILYYPWELGYGVRNKTTNVRKNGYGVSELETLMDLVTYILWGVQYNGNFFRQGSQPKGFINVKNGNVDNTTLNEFRTAWRQTMAGVQNSHKLAVIQGMDLEWIDLHHCLHGDSEVFTKDGGQTLESILKGGSEAFTEIWDGKSFSKAKVFRTEEKQVMELKLSNRLKIKTSPDHKFLTLRNNEPTWVERKDISLDDYVFVNKRPVDSEKANIEYKGVRAEEDLFELIGWITGDGHIGDNANSKRIIRTFYHPEKELDILEGHIETCKKYGINAKKYIYRVSEEVKAKKIASGSMKSMIGAYPVLTLLDADFFNWYVDLGFTSSREGKNIPEFLYSFDSGLKCAYLRGFFSADGHRSEDAGRVDLTISSKPLKWQTRMLLMSEGIRCSSYKGKRRPSTFGGFQEDTILLIKDREVFYEKINFIQKYKRVDSIVRERSSYRVNEAPISFIRDLALKVKVFNRTLGIDEKLNKKDLHDLLNISKGHQKASLSKVLYYAEKINYPVPSFLKDYSLEQVMELTETDEFVDMVDVEMFNEDHRFVANGMVVHNSNRDMEFTQWIEFLIVMFCSVYTIDPSELGFNFRQQAQIFGQEGQQARLDHSKNKGLKPLLRFLKGIINKFIVSELDEGLEFVFTGIDTEDEAAQVELDSKKLAAGMVSFEKTFEKHEGEKYDEKKHTILNQIHLQLKQAQQFGGEESNQAVDEMTGEPDAGAENPFAEFEKAGQSDPIISAALSYVDNCFKR